MNGRVSLRHLRPLQKKRTEAFFADGQRAGQPFFAGSPPDRAAAGSLPAGLKANLESMSGYGLDGVRVTYGSPEPERLGALAYARGTEIHLGPGQEKHLPHEAWHVVQQMQGRVATTSTSLHAPVNDDAALESEADRMGAIARRRTTLAGREPPRHGCGCGCATCAGGNLQPRRTSAGGGKGTAAVWRKAWTTAVIQFERPAEIVDHTFLGLGVAVHPTMQSRLRQVEDHLQTEYDALPATDRPATLRDYAGVNSIGGWRESTSSHGTGRAVDVNYNAQPYIATRTREGGTTTYGGEEGDATAATRALRQPAVEVYDRAMSFTWTNPYDSDVADVGNRRVGETAAEAYRRFRAASDALATYLGLAFRTDYQDVRRAPVNDPEGISGADLLAAIPTTERKDETTAVAEIQAFMDDTFWEALHPAYPLTAREQYIRILRDYEIVRRPMQYGAPSTAPARTRNPARGFLHLPEHFVVAMMDVGRLRWGACEFSAVSNGDVHHFDLRTPYHSPVPQPTQGEAAPE
jgi:hypothetical protein